MGGMSKSHDLEYLNEAGKAVSALLPDHHGFIILAVPYKGGDKRLKYISNLERESAILVLQEFLKKGCGEDEWLKHVPS